MTEPISEGALSDKTLEQWCAYITPDSPTALLVAEVRRLRAVVADKDREIAGLVRTCNSWETNYEDARRHAHAVLAEYDKWAEAYDE